MDDRLLSISDINRTLFIDDPSVNQIKKHSKRNTKKRYKKNQSEQFLSFEKPITSIVCNK